MKKKLSKSVVCIGIAIASLAPQFTLAQQLAARPSPAGSDQFVIPANSSFYACNFDLGVQFSGKAGALALPGGRFVGISTSPGFFVTLTNMTDQTKTVTLNITGTIKQSLDSYGNNVYTANGRSLVGDPIPGLVLVVGNYKWVFDSSNNLVENLNGTGRMMPVCPMVE